MIFILTHMSSIRPQPKPILLIALSASVFLICLSLIFPDIRASLFTFTQTTSSTASVGIASQHPEYIVTLKSAPVLQRLDQQQWHAAQAERRMLNTMTVSQTTTKQSFKMANVYAASILDIQGSSTSSSANPIPRDMLPSSSSVASVQSSSTPVVSPSSVGQLASSESSAQAPAIPPNSSTPPAVDSTSSVATSSTPSSEAPISSSNFSVATSSASSASTSTISTPAIDALRDQVQLLEKTIGDEQLTVAMSAQAQLVRSFVLTENAFVASLTDQQVSSLRSDVRVASVEPVVSVTTVLDRSVPQMGANTVWTKDASGTDCHISGLPCITGSGVHIGIIDTGIDYTHPDLGGCTGALCKVKDGYNVMNPTDPWIDDNGHGTHIAAIAAGNGVLKGVAPDASLYAFKAMDKNGAGSSTTIIAGIERAMDPNGDGDLTDHMDVINLSIGCNSCHSSDDAMSRAVDTAVDAGVIVVTAAGNNGPTDGTINSPGTARKSITVGSVDRAGALSTYTAHGPTTSFDVKPDVLAPGDGICAAMKEGSTLGTPCIDANHMALSGTSMAAPHITGLAALMHQAHPDWTPAEVKFAMRSTAKGMTTFDPKSVAISGYGLVDSVKAVTTQTPFEPVALTTAGGFDGKIDITGTINIPTVASYTLTAASLQSNDVQVLTTVNHAPTSTVLLPQFDTTTLKAGEQYILVLEVTDGSGRIERDATYFSSTRALPPSGTDIALSRSGPDTIVRGDNATFTLHIQNKGTLAAPLTTVSDYYPIDNGFSLIANKSTAGCKPTGLSLVRCDVGTLAAGASTTITLVYATTLPTTCTLQTVQSYAYAATQVVDSDPTNNRSTTLQSQMLCPTADLSIIASGPQTSMVGEPVIYTLGIRNAGPATANITKVTAMLPAGIVFNSSNDSSCKIDTLGKLTCTTPLLAADATKTIALNTHLAPSTACPGSISLQPNVASNTNDPQLTNNASSVITTNFTCRPDVSIAQSGPSSVIKGSAMTDTVIFTNNGTMTSAPMAVKMVLPAGMAFAPAPQSSASCSGAGGFISCGIASLSPHGTVRLNITLKAINPVCNAQIATSAYIKQAAPDPNPNNDKATPDIMTTVLCP